MKKSIKNTIVSNRIKNIANRLRHDAESYDVKFPIGYANLLEEISEELRKS